MLVADIPPVPAQETPIVWVQTVPRSGEDGARLDDVRNEATCGAMPVGYCALRGLLAEGTQENDAASQRDFIEKLQTDFNVNEKDLDMLFMAMPDVAPLPVHETVTLAAASTSARKMTYGVCQFAPQPGYSGFATELSPSTYMKDFLPKEFRDRMEGKHGGRLSQEEWEWYGAWPASFSIKILRVPQHGRMIDSGTTIYGSGINKYLPDDGFTGKDRVDLLVEGKDMNGRPISLKLIYFINVVTDSEFHKDGNYDQLVKKYCGTTKGRWRISDGVDGTTPLAAYLDATLADTSPRRAQ